MPQDNSDGTNLGENSAGNSRRRPFRTGVSPLSGRNLSELKLPKFEDDNNAKTPMTVDEVKEKLRAAFPGIEL